MIAEILESMTLVLLVLVMMGFVVVGYYHSYDAYKEYRRDLRRGAADYYIALFFSLMLFIVSTYGVLACLLILADTMGW